ncbi:uroporphyrinogen-III C-methyltransferase [Acidimangrovimonas sediminis]|uniref:uroporphyrinogen-III C-methyltransferase n=1 Tax=Acidimangrovimonas sediminis TaxID=2056283 RepID=UPI000C8077AB|nr:uroporphyrinogen-III C-methyltransferase [Acidimangrovimonas sediminis]
MFRTPEDTAATDLPQRGTLPGTVALVGAGPGDAELLTLKAARALAAAEVVIHDRLVSDEVLALAGPAARLIAVGKEGFGPSVPQETTNALMVTEALKGLRVVRLKGGDPAVFARLDEEIAALDAAGIAWQVVPGITAASAAAASLGQGLTARGRNKGVRLITGHDVKGFADQDWRALAAPGAVAAIYMGKRAARFIQGRLMMHGAAAATPVTLVENASRRDERVIAATLATLPDEASGLAGPAILLLGLAPRAALATAREASA